MGRIIRSGMLTALLEAVPGTIGPLGICEAVTVDGRERAVL